MRVADIALPPYTKKMEIWNTLSHGLGVVFGLIAGPFAITKAAVTHDALSVLSIAIYVVTMIVLYAGSAIYHGLAPSNAKRVMRVIDHDNVFLLLMGSYLPYCLISLRHTPDGFPWGYVIGGIVWGLCLLGIVLNSINIKRFAIANFIIQVLMGSAIVSAFYPLSQTIGWAGVITLLISGMFYWVGAALYGIGGKKEPWIHTVFHFFILCGTIMMFVSIYAFVLQ